MYKIRRILAFCMAFIMIITLFNVPHYSYAKGGTLTVKMNTKELKTDIATISASDILNNNMVLTFNKDVNLLKTINGEAITLDTPDTVSKVSTFLSTYIKLVEVGKSENIFNAAYMVKENVEITGSTITLKNLTGKIVEGKKYQLRVDITAFKDNNTNYGDAPYDAILNTANNQFGVYKTVGASSEEMSLGSATATEINDALEKNIEITLKDYSGMVINDKAGVFEDNNVSITDEYKKYIIASKFSFTPAIADISTLATNTSFFEFKTENKSKKIVIKSDFWKQKGSIGENTLVIKQGTFIIDGNKYPSADVTIKVNIPEVASDITLNTFDNSDNIVPKSEKVALGDTSKTYSNVHIATPIKIDFKNAKTNEPISLQANESTATAQDIFTLVKDGETANLIGTDFSVDSFNANGASNSITIKPSASKKFVAGGKYKLTINTEKLKTQAGMKLNDKKFVYNISVEPEPTATITTANDSFTINFSRKVDMNSIGNTSDIIIENKRTSQKVELTGLNIKKDTNTGKSITVSGVPDGKYIIKVNTASKNIVRTDVNTPANPTIASTEKLPVKEVILDEVILEKKKYDVSTGMTLKKYTDVSTDFNIGFDNKQSADNKDVDVDSIINKIVIGLNRPDGKDLQIQGSATDAVTIQPNLNAFTVTQMQNNSYQLDKVELQSTTSLAPNTKYTVTIKKDKFFYDNKSDSPAGALNTTEEYIFTTESAPVATLETKAIEKSSGNQITITFTRPVELTKAEQDIINQNLVTVKDSATAPIIIKSIVKADETNKKYNLILDEASLASAKVGRATVVVKNNAFKRKESKSLNLSSDLNATFDLTRPKNSVKVDFTVSKVSNDEVTSDAILSTQNTIPPTDNTSSSGNMNNVYIDTNIKINYSIDIKSNAGKPISDIIKITENGTEKNVTELFDVSNTSTATKEILLTKKSGLKPDAKYVITVNNENLIDSENDIALTGIYRIDLNTEKTPIATQGDMVNKDYIVNFDRKVDAIKVTDFELAKLNEFGSYQSVTVSDTDIQMIDNTQLVIKNLEKGKYTFKLNVSDKKVKRKTIKQGETPLCVKEFLGKETDEKIADFEIKSLASTVSDYITLDRFVNNATTSVNVNKTTDTVKDNTNINTNTKIYVKYTIPYKNSAEPTKDFELKKADGTVINIKTVTPKNKDNAVDGVELEIDGLLEPDVTYNLKVLKEKFINVQGVPAGVTRETEDYTFITDTKPVPNKDDKNKIENKDLDQKIKVLFDKNIELLDKSKIKIDGASPILDVVVNANTMDITIGKDVAKALSLGTHKVAFEDGAVKRIKSENITNKASEAIFEVVKDAAIVKKEEEEAQKAEDAKKAEEAAKAKIEADKKAAEKAAAEKKATEQAKIEAEKAAKEALRDTVADALVDEIQTRYQAEYGADFEYKSFDDYIKNKYGRSYTGSVKDFLKKEGYVDDFISKYGRDNSNVRQNAVDYMNRYGGFAYPYSEDYNNPLFKNPFTSGSRKEGYYDYYNKYDYGYRYPEIRVGDDNLSQANREKDEILKQKEKELIAKERGFAINKGTNYAVGANNAPVIVISPKSRYFTEKDTYGNSRQVDMGVAPVSVNGRTYVAITPLAQKLGMWINYNNQTKTTTMSKAGKTIAVTTNSSYININGKNENMGIRPIMRNGKMMIPVQYLSKAFVLDTSKITYEVDGSIVINNY